MKQRDKIFLLTLPYPPCPYSMAQVIKIYQNLPKILSQGWTGRGSSNGPRLWCNNWPWRSTRWQLHLEVILKSQSLTTRVFFLWGGSQITYFPSLTKFTMEDEPSGRPKDVQSNIVLYRVLATIFFILPSGTRWATSPSIGHGGLMLSSMSFILSCQEYFGLSDNSSERLHNRYFKREIPFFV